MITMEEMRQGLTLVVNRHTNIVRCDGRYIAVPVGYSAKIVDTNGAPKWVCGEVRETEVHAMFDGMMQLLGFGSYVDYKLKDAT